MDLGNVRIHTGLDAASSARSLGAKAYTKGTDIVFAAGRYAPESASGRRLLAHEIVHVAQQSTSLGGRPRIQLTPDSEKSGANRWISLPKPLQAVLLRSYHRGALQFCEKRARRDFASCYDREAGADKRTAILTIYKKLAALDLWKHVGVLRGAWTVGASFRTSGSTSSLRQDLMKKQGMCMDAGVGNLLHRSATAFREVSSTSGLHVLVQGGGLFSAHIDKTSPVARRDRRGDCVHHTQRALRHLGTEVIPESKYNPLKLQVFPHQTRVPAERSQVSGRRRDLPPALIGWSWRF